MRELIRSTKDISTLRSGLSKIVEVLDEEARQIPESIATFWHEQITVEMLEGENIEVIEITTASPEEAIAKLNMSAKT